MGNRFQNLVNDSCTLAIKHLYSGVLADAYQILDVTILNSAFHPIAVIPASQISHIDLGTYQVTAPGSLFNFPGTYYDVWRLVPISGSAQRSLMFNINVVNQILPATPDFTAILNGCTLTELDACLLKKNYLYSVAGALDGYFLPDSMLQHHIDVAISNTQSDLGMPLRAMRVLTRPYGASTAMNPVIGTDYDEDGELLQWSALSGPWGMIRLPHTGIIRVSGLRGVFGGRIVYEVPLSWIERNELKNGFIRIRPTTIGALNNLVDESGQFLDMTLLESMGNNTVPGFWAADYTYSGGKTDEYGRFDKEICDVIMKKAAIQILNHLSMAITRGIGSRSAGVDGLSSSINYLASADRGIFSSLSAQYEADVSQERMLDLRRKKKSIFVGFI